MVTMNPLKSILLRLHPDFNGGDSSRVDELQDFLSERRLQRQCAGGCGRKLPKVRVKHGCTYYSRLCWQLSKRGESCAGALSACLMLLLCGCTAPHASRSTQQADMPLSPLTASVSRQSSIVSSGNQQGADTLAVVKPTTITISWRSNMPGDAIVTGLQSSTDLINWTTLCETNPFEDCTNIFVIQRSEPILFLRTYNRVEL